MTDNDPWIPSPETAMRRVQRLRESGYSHVIDGQEVIGVEIPADADMEEVKRRLRAFIQDALQRM